MSSRNRNGLAVLLRAFLLFFGYFTMENVFAYSYWGAPIGTFLYFPSLSKTCMIAITLVYFGLGFRTRITGNTRIPRALQIIRYSVVVAVTISYILDSCNFFLTLAYQQTPIWFNFLTRSVVPALFITDFLAFDRGEPMEKLDIVMALALPLFFLAYTFIYIMADPLSMYLGDHLYYYFFTDLNIESVAAPGLDLGVVWTGLILFGSSLLVGALYRFIQVKTIRGDGVEGRTES